MGKIIKFFKIALTSLFENKSRSILTMLGIVIGIASVILMISVGKGAESLILASVESFGSRSIFIQPGGGTSGGPPSITAFDKVKYKDYLAVKKLDYLENVTPILTYQGPISYQNKDLRTTVVGSNDQYLVAISSQVINGKFIDENDLNFSKRVAVLGYKIADEFFGDQDPLGKIIKIQQKSFTVIGVMDKQGQKFFQDFDKRILIPITTMRAQIRGVDYLQSILANVKGNINQAMEDLRFFIRKRHNLYNLENDPNKDDFRVVSQVDAVDTFQSVSSVLTLFLVLIAAISLLVGGIGIMNIMLVAISERTREIGLRKAVGASNRDIMWQFVMEAVTITFIAGVLGILIGIIFSYLIAIIVSSYQPDWKFVVTLDSVILSFIVSGMIGLVFGLYPARNAAKLNPIDALRFE